ncbi:MAG: hypothetical protein WDZ59_03975 [Pirellulales bacterium]
MATKKGRRGRKPAGQKKNGASSVNKSEAVRDQLRRDPDAKPKAISAALAEQGIKVEPAYVSIIKTKFKTAPNGQGRRGRGRGGKVDIDNLLVAKRFAEQMGGVDQARQALDVLDRLR